MSLGHRALYFSGEESAGQLRLRADRLGLDLDALEVLATTDANIVAATIEAERPAFAVIDSIQTMAPSSDAVAGTPASVTRVTHLLMRTAKAVGTTLIIIGHVNKEAAIAGPKTLEHLVDAVFLLEGDRHGFFRILRGTKNRFGATDEIGLFEMTDKGMIGVPTPSPLHLDAGTAFGRVVTPVVEGTRPICVEVQALVAKASYNTGRRVALGVADKRVAMLLAVLERYADIDLSAHDVYVQVSSGIAVEETAIDAAICVAIASSYWSTPVGEDICVAGEVGLGGEVRPVRAMSSRAKEAGRLGFDRLVGPRLADAPSGIAHYDGVRDVRELLSRTGVLAPSGASPTKGAAVTFRGRRGAGSEEPSDD